MLELNTFEEWFESLDCVNNIYHIDIHNININQELKSEFQKGKLLVLFKPEIKPDGGSLDAPMEKWECMFFVLEKLTLKGADEAERKRVRNETLNVSRLIKQKMFETGADISLCHFFNHINHLSVSHNFVGPVFLNMYGWVTEFSFSIPFR